MATIFGTLSSLGKPLLISKGAPSIKVDEWSFRMHYRLTSLMLFLFSALVCMREYLGDHIKCVHMQEDEEDRLISRRVLETYCFITTTFTVPYNNTPSKNMQKLETLQRVGGPGYIAGKNERVWHGYYQWVPFYLFLCGLVFSIPHALWKTINGNKLKDLVQELNVGNAGMEKDKKQNQIAALASYLVRSKGEHRSWALSYCLCELANFVFLIGCMFLTDLFLGKEFSSYGLEVVRFLEKDPEERIDPMSRVFPRVTKCNINTYGPSGSIQKFDALCILPLNIINEKIFTFLWFWLLMVAVASSFSIIYRVTSYMSLSSRMDTLRQRIHAKERGEEGEARLVDQITEYSDWLLLKLLALNMDSFTFGNLINSISSLNHLP